MKKHLLVQNQFSSTAVKMRAEFDRRFNDPKETRSERFVWDFWHVPDQYTLLRTPADHFFSAPLYNKFLKQLTDWGRENLGCAAVTPPWLSYYIEGCQQQLHSDVPHGPWAFVFSLSPKRRVFSGGETILLKPEVLSYWSSFRDAEDRELSSFVERVQPEFNRLVVFDPRLPHGVSRVAGTMDPREARLVVHGWFTEPKPYMKGPLRASRVAGPLDEAVSQFVNALACDGQWHGTVSLRIKVAASGKAGAPQILADTLVPVDADPRRVASVRLLLKRSFAGLKFPAAKGPTEITLPLLFR